MLEDAQKVQNEKIKVSEPVNELIRNLKKISQEEELRKETSANIYTSRVVDSAAFVYEKVRNLIDYQDEHLLRRSAINRILSRRIYLPPAQDSIALGLIKELIRAGYIKNEMATNEKIEIIDQIIQRYLIIIKSLSRESKKYFVSIASAEVEDVLTSHDKEKALVRIMQKVIKHDLEKLDISTIHNISDLDQQLFIATYKIFLKSDKSILRYELFKKAVPNWKELDKKIPHSEIAGFLHSAKKKIDQEIDLALAGPLVRTAQVYNPSFIILQDIIQQNITVTEEILDNPRRLEDEVNYIAKSYYKRYQEKLARGIIRATLFIFLTKMILGIILEIPYDLFIAGKLYLTPLLVNLIFPPALMASTYFLIYVPGQKNTDRLLENIKGIVYSQTDYQLLADKITPVRRGSFLGNLLNIIYVITFIVSFAVLIWILLLLHYNLMSGLVFFFFLSIVSFFAFRLRQSATELVVTEEKEGVLASLLDFLFLPFLSIGHWISVKFANWNIFLFILDFIIEAPFKTILEIIEHWSNFIREKKEEMLSKQ